MLLILPENYVIRDQFVQSWLALGLIEVRERLGFENFVKTLPRVMDPTAFGLKFPQELWKDYGEWWADLKKQAERFVKGYWQPQNNLSDAAAQAKIKELLEMERANYEKLLPLKAKAHASIRDSLVLIPGGMFMMGADDITGDEKPVHAVWVSSFLMMDVTVTNAMWEAVMGSRPSARYDKKGKIFSGDNQPVVGVNWHEATEFAKKVGGVLPSETQWERAAKGGRDYAYGTKDGTLSHELAVYGNLANHQFTAPVKSRPANPFGLYDMCGNVWEWCKDGWRRVYTEEPVINPICIATSTFILRGGSGFDLLLRCARGAYRSNRRPGDHGRGIGLRVAMARQDS